MRPFIVTSLLLALLAGCASLEPVPLYPRASSFYPAAVLPSLSLPDAGWHPYAWAGSSDNQEMRDVDAEDPHRSGTWATTWAGGGGVLYQSMDLREDWAFGWYGSAEAGYELQNVLVDYKVEEYEDEPDLSDSDAALFPARRWAQNLTTTARAGVQGKFYIGTGTLYGLLAARLESGDYAAFRRQADGIGRFVNLSDGPLTGGYGLGMAADIGFREYWAAGVNLEIRSYWAHSQTVQEAHVDEQAGDYGTWVMTRGTGGTYHQVLVLRSGYYFDFQHLRFGMGAAIEDSSLFSGESLLNSPSVDFTLAYRW